MKMIIRWHLAVLIMLLLAGSGVQAQDDTLKIVHITDLHVIFDWPLYQEDLARNRAIRDKEAASFREFLQTVPEQAEADMIIATGDLLDSYEAESHDGTMLDSAVAKFASVVNKSSIPIYLTLGNHDLVSYSWGNDSRQVHQNNAGQSRAEWIRNAPCFQNGIYYNQIHHIGNTTYNLIYLDNSYVKFSAEENISIPTIDKAQLHWLKARLQESSDDVEIILMHLPFMLNKSQPDFSELYNVLSTHPTARLILAGHQHKNRVAEVSTDNETSVIQVQTADLMRNTNNWRLISLTEKNILVSSPGDTETELVIPAKL
jgi:predicted MPP superfamily phosphohydrolase